MTNKRRKQTRINGFSIAGAMIGTLIVGAVTVGGSMLYADYKQDQVAQGRGHQLGTGLEQLDRFARKYQTQLTGGASITGVANAYAPTTAEMQALGFAASGFSDGAQPGGAIVFQITREPAGCAAAKCILALKAVTSGSVKIDGAANAAFAQRIAGYVSNGAGWSNLATDAAKLSKNGRTIDNPLGSVPAIVAAVAWLGNGQASQVVPPPSTTYRHFSCAAGYSGSGKDQHQTTTTDKWGVTTTSGWITDSYDCTADPVCSNGATNYPTCTFPTSSGSTGGGTGSTGGGTDPGGQCTNGALDYPICTPKETVCTNGATNPPVCGCTNGATNYPTCGCTNGATNYPTCGCTNGATNYPTCSVAKPACISPGYGSTSAGMPGYCIDCDNVAWVDGSFSANTTSTQRGCYLNFGTN